MAEKMARHFQGPDSGSFSAVHEVEKHLWRISFKIGVTLVQHCMVSVFTVHRYLPAIAFVFSHC